MGRKYTLSASPFDVWTVAMLGFTNTVWIPSSFRALTACKITDLDLHFDVAKQMFVHIWLNLFKLKVPMPNL